jgi:XTP/dITP diphosphohydrolase
VDIPLIVASNNQHKLEEIEAIIGKYYALQSMASIGFVEEIEETGTSFHENAAIKARAIFNRYGVDCLSDDSGLAIDVLNGAPGVYSARFAGEPVNHEKNIDKVLFELEGKSDRNARFVTVLCLIRNGKEYFFEGEIKGKILEEKRGTNGFGYDPIFVPEGFDKSFAELDAAQKNKISHRSNALAKMQEYLQSIT